MKGFFGRNSEDRRITPVEQREFLRETGEYEADYENAMKFVQETLHKEKLISEYGRVA